MKDWIKVVDWKILPNGGTQLVYISNNKRMCARYPFQISEATFVQSILVQRARIRGELP